jgi:hypothetical protein
LDPIVWILILLLVLAISILIHTLAAVGLVQRFQLFLLILRVIFACIRSRILAFILVFTLTRVLLLTLGLDI